MEDSISEFNCDLLTDKDSLADVLDKDSMDVLDGPTPRSRCNTWPKLTLSPPVVQPQGTEGGGAFAGEVRGSDHSSADHSPASSIGTPHTVLPLVSEEEHVEEDPQPTTATRHKSSSRRNPWGNCSYADLITQAIQSAPEQRLTLSQIYEWLVKNVPFFADKGDTNSSAGWKNSIRHNLSLHQKFVRVQNEGAGKSSWWMINPEVKPGVKPSRRRAMSMETSSRQPSARGKRATKRRVDSLTSTGSSVGLSRGSSSQALERTSSTSSVLSDQFDSSPLGGGFSPEQYRARTSSNASSTGRLSPFRPRTFSNASECGGGHSSPPTNLDAPPMSPWPLTNNFSEQLTLAEDVPTKSDESSNDYDILNSNLASEILKSYLEPPQRQANEVVKQEILESNNEPGHKITILEPRDPRENGSDLFSNFDVKRNNFLNGGSVVSTKRPILPSDHLHRGALGNSDLQREIQMKMLREQVERERAKVQQQEQQRIMQLQQQQQALLLQQQQQQQINELNGGDHLMDLVASSAHVLDDVPTVISHQLPQQQQPQQQQQPAYHEFELPSLDLEEGMLEELLKYESSFNLLSDLEFSPMDGVDPVSVGGKPTVPVSSAAHVVTSMGSF